MNRPETTVRKFWERVDRSAGPDACWAWTGTKKEDGRGRVIVDGRVVYAYRRAWELVNGEPIPAHLHACHHCDNPNCVNPAHIFLGTTRDNLRDAAAKGRTRNGVRFGMDHHKVTVADERVAEARRMYAGGRFTQDEIAAHFGVAQSTVSRWVLGQVRAVGAQRHQAGAA